MPDPRAFGYLDFLEDPTAGVVGGYLIISERGRPLEFHCTAPVLASRAQQILFGPTLRPHLLGERIAASLVKRAAIRPQLLLVSHIDLAAFEPDGLPAIAVFGGGGEAAAPSGPWESIDGFNETVWSRPGDSESVAAELATLLEAVELAEPFERIREAIREAQRITQGEAPNRDAA